MTERSSGQGRADDWARGYSGEPYSGDPYPGEAYPGEAYSGETYQGETYYGAGPATQAMPAAGTAGQGAAGPGMAGPGMAGQSMPGPGIGEPATGMTGPGMSSPGMGAATAEHQLPRQATDSRSFLSALFDFSFTSFVTTRIIKVLYKLILALTVLYALVFTIYAFRLSAGLGLATLIVGDPLFIVIVMAFWRLVLESFVVVFRIAEDTRAMRERGEGS